MKTETVIGAHESHYPGLVFVPVPEGKQVKNRLHLDLVPHGGTREDQEARAPGSSRWARRGSASANPPTWAGSCWPTRSATSSASWRRRSRRPVAEVRMH
jgi:hypothetical protein